MQSGPHRRTRRDAYQQTLFSRHAPRGFNGIFVFHADDLIVDFRVEYVRYEARSDALNGVRAFLAARKHGRGIRFDDDTLEG